MAEKFNGFSHDEILKITGVREGGAGGGKRAANLEAAKQALRNQPGIRRMPDKLFRQADQLRKQQSQPQPSEKKPQKVQEVAKKAKLGAGTPTEMPAPDDVVAVEPLDLERPMSDSLMQALYQGHQVKTPSTATYTDAAGESSETTDDSSILKISSGSGTGNGSNGSTDDASILPSTKDDSSARDSERLNTDSPFKGVSLKDFEQHRRMIEEQNKQKKQMLYKAIEQHTQKTAAESRKIEEIRHELSKLESDLAVDVALLRKQIDNACIHFANVEKQYVKIEAQFLKSKIELHNASEKKELLTEHLCTVIAHNEDRKAQKLTELMQKVGLTPEDEAPASPPNQND